MEKLVECVPNFSEGRDRAKMDAIVGAMLAGGDVALLDRQMDSDHHRSVITLAGPPEAVGEAAVRGAGRAAELIDLTLHQGAHPRMGATDVVPFVPLRGVTLEDCVRIAEWAAEQIWLRFQIPTFLYGAAARRPDRRDLENIRRGQFEKLRRGVASDPALRPDFGEPRLHPTAGATAVGARNFLIAYNIHLSADDARAARAIARKIRASSGGLPCVKAIGIWLPSRKLAQVSINLTDYEVTSLETIFDAVEREAAALEVRVLGSEIVGLVPRQALPADAEHRLRIENYRAERILENRLAQALERTPPFSAGPGR